MGVGTRTAITDTGPPLHLCEINQERQIALFELLIVSQFVRDELANHNVWDNGTIGQEKRRDGETETRRNGETGKRRKFTHYASRITIYASRLASSEWLREGFVANICCRLTSRQVAAIYALRITLYDTNLFVADATPTRKRQRIASGE